MLEAEARTKLGILLTAPDPLKLKKEQYNGILTNIPGLTWGEVNFIFSSQGKTLQEKRATLLTLAKKKLAIEYGVDCGIIERASIVSMNQTPQVLQVQGIPDVVIKRFMLGKTFTTQQDLQQKMKEMKESKEGIGELEQLLTKTHATQVSKFPDTTTSNEEYLALNYYDAWKKKLSDEMLQLTPGTYNSNPEESSSLSSPTSSVGGGSEVSADSIKKTGPSWIDKAIDANNRQEKSQLPSQHKIKPR